MEYLVFGMFGRLESLSVELNATKQRSFILSKDGCALLGSVPAVMENQTKEGAPDAVPVLGKVIGAIGA
eukprot:3901255-Amphidinium_carterae.1